MQQYSLNIYKKFNFLTFFCKFKFLTIIGWVYYLNFKIKNEIKEAAVFENEAYFSDFKIKNGRFNLKSLS